MNKMDLVVARFSEDITWLLQIPQHIRIFLYNKGDVIEDPDLLSRIHLIKSRPNKGREADSYLAHLRSGESNGTEWTVFTQGDPFPHSPDFIHLLDCSDRWQDVQPLTFRWLRSRNIPPELILDKERHEWLGPLRIRREIFSLRNWGAITFLDAGISNTLNTYLTYHGLPHGTNLAEHFLRNASWDKLANEASEAQLGAFCYGAIFGIRKNKLEAVPDGILKRLEELACSCQIHPYIFERLWLHFFGEPFVRIPKSVS